MTAFHIIPNLGAGRATVTADDEANGTIPIGTVIRERHKSAITNATGWRWFPECEAMAGHGIGSPRRVGRPHGYETRINAARALWAHVVDAHPDVLIRRSL